MLGTSVFMGSAGLKLRTLTCDGWIIWNVSPPVTVSDSLETNMHSAVDVNGCDSTAVVPELEESIQAYTLLVTSLSMSPTKGATDCPRLTLKSWPVARFRCVALDSVPDPTVDSVPVMKNDPAAVTAGVT